MTFVPTGVNGLNRRHKRRIPLSVWVAVAVLVLVLFGCIATIAYVNLYGDSPDEKEEEEEEERSWAVVLGGRGDTFDRHIEVQAHTVNMSLKYKKKVLQN